MSFFIHDPQDQTFYYKTIAELDQAMNDFDFLGKYCDDGWSEEVENVIAGYIPDGLKRIDDEESDDWEEEYDFFRQHATHIATMIDKRSRPDDLEDGDTDEEGTYWGEYDYICNYAFLPVNS